MPIIQAWSPDGRYLGVAGTGGSIGLWDAVKGEELPALRGHTGPVYALTFSPDGKQLLSAGQDRTIRVWETSGWKEVQTLRDEAAVVTRLLVSPDGKYLVANRLDRKLEVWDAGAWKKVQEFEGSPAELSFAGDGRLLWFSNRERRLSVRDVATGQELFGRRWPLGTGTRWLDAQFWPDARHLAIRHTVQVETPNGLQDVQALRVQELGSGREVLQFRVSLGVGNAIVANAPDGRRVLVQQGGQLGLWDASTGKQLLVLKAKGWRGPLGGVGSFSPDGRYLAVRGGTTDNLSTLRLWDGRTGEELPELPQSTSPVSFRSPVFSADGKQLAAFLDDPEHIEVRLWPLPSGAPLIIRRAAEGQGYLTGLAFSPDGKFLCAAGAGQGRVATVWSTATGEVVQVLKSLTTDGVSDIVFSSDGRRVAGSCGRTVKLWDTATWQEVLTLHGATFDISRLAFSPDGRRLLGLSVAADCGVWVWDAASEAKERQVERQ
jgi:WD40 repeat protein